MTVVTPVNVGSAPNDGTGDPIRTAFQKINASLNNINAASVESIASSITAGQIATFSDTTGDVLTNATVSGYLKATAGVLSSVSQIPLSGISGTGTAAAQTAFVYNVKDYGALANQMTIGNVTTTSSSYSIHSSSYTFVASDVGKYITIPGAGAAAATLYTTIASVSAGNAIVAIAAGTSIAGTGTATFYSDDTTAINNAITACNAAGGGDVVMPAGIYRIKGDNTAADGAVVLLDNVTLSGSGMQATIIKLIDSYASLDNIGITGLVRTPSGISNTNITVRDLTIDGNQANNAYSGTYNNRIIGFYSGVTPDIPCTAAITRSGSTATATVASTSGLVNGQTVSFYNVNQSQYFGDQVITSIPNSTTFTFTVTGSPATPSTTNDNGYPLFYPSSAALATDYDIRLFNVEILNCNYYGCDPHERTTRLHVDGCYLHNNGTDGIVLDYIIDGIVTNSRTINNGRHGINVTTTSNNCQIIDCISEGNGFDAVNGDPGHGLVMQRGIGHIPFPYQNSVIGGSYNNNYANGILISLADHNSVIGANAFGNGNQNIRLFGARYNNISNPVLTNPSQSALGSFDDVNVADYYLTLTSLTQTGGVATAAVNGTDPNAVHNLNAGDLITVIGATPSGYNVSSVAVASTPTTGTFTFAVSSSLTSPATGTIQVYAPYYTASYNSVTGVASTSLESDARYGLKEELSYIGSGYNSYSIISVIGAASGVYELENSRSTMDGTVGQYGLTLTQAQQNIGVTYGYDDISTSTSTTVTPGCNFINCAFTASGQTLTLYPMNVPGAPQKGTEILITNSGLYSFTFYAQDGSTSLISNLAPGKQARLQVTSNSTANGSFNRIFPANTGVKVNTASTYTISNPGDDQGTVVFNDSSPVAVAVGAASGFQMGFVTTLKNIGTGLVTFTSTSGAGETIDGQATLTIPQYSAFEIYTDQVNWYVRAANNTATSAPTRTAWTTSSSAITWFAGTAPSGTIVQNLTWQEEGGYCVFDMIITASVGGVTVTGINLDFPVVLPSPVACPNANGNGDLICAVQAFLGSAITAVSSVMRASINVNTSSATGYSIECAGGSASATVVLISGRYPC